MASSLNDDERSKFEELLSVVSSEDLFSLAKTITLNSILPVNKEDAIRTILQHETSLQQGLNRKKITRDIIFKYLHSKNIPFQGTLDKPKLIEIILSYWEERKLVISNECQENNDNSTIVTNENENLFAFKFSEWFYSRLNEDFRQDTGISLDEVDFMNDSRVAIKVIIGNEEEIRTSTNAEGSLYLIRLVRHQFGLYFSPNLTKEGTRGSVEPHGLMMVASCGTLHVGEGESVGVFEQKFGLLKDPLAGNNWKIQMTEMILRLKRNTQVSHPEMAIESN